MGKAGSCGGVVPRRGVADGMLASDWLAVVLLSAYGRIELRVLFAAAVFGVRAFC